MKYLNHIKKIIKLPFGIILMPIFILIGFFVTDWEDHRDITYFKETIKNLIW